MSNQTEDEAVEAVDLDPGQVTEGTVISLQNDENGDWYRLRSTTECRSILNYIATGDLKQAVRADEIRATRNSWTAPPTRPRIAENQAPQNPAAAQRARQTTNAPPQSPAGSSNTVLPQPSQVTGASR